MPLQARPEQVDLDRMIREGRPIEDIAGKLKYSPQYIRRRKKRLAIKDAQPKPTTSEPAGTERIEKVQVLPEDTGETQEQKLAGEGQLKQLAPDQNIAELIDARNITGLFVAINDMLPDRYKRPQDSLNILGQVWERPLNRVMSEHLTEDYDLIFAALVTITVFAPVPVAMLRDRQEEAKKKNEQAKRLTENASQS